MSAGDVRHGSDHDRNGEAVRERAAQRTGACPICAAQILFRADRSRGGEYHHKRSDELSGQLLRQVVQEQLRDVGQESSRTDSNGFGNWRSKNLRKKLEPSSVV